MSEKWTGRKRRTNHLVRAMASTLLKQRRIVPEQLHGLCRLTWITSNNHGPDAPYVASTKIPALESILQKQRGESTLAGVAEDAAQWTGSPQTKKLILGDTGFTNFYKAYRNSSLDWIRDNMETLIPLFRTAFHLNTDVQGLSLVRKIMTLPRIPKANHNDELMRPEFLLSPVFFALDKRIRFPVMNGNAGVTALLKKLKVFNEPLDEQYLHMIRLYGKGGIDDAADLDEIGGDLPELVGVGTTDPTKHLLTEKKTAGRNIPLKDEADLKVLQKELLVNCRKIHNKLTNQLRKLLTDYTLLEGISKSALFDVLVKNFDGSKTDLLIEVKSSIEPPHIRMAVGQVLDYWFRINGKIEPRVAILLPKEPDNLTKDFLSWQKIGLLWFSGETLKTSSPWLSTLAAHSVVP
jgi:hypothetical protein